MSSHNRSIAGDTELRSTYSSSASVRLFCEVQPKFPCLACLPLLCRFQHVLTGGIPDWLLARPISQAPETAWGLSGIS